jgi:hypothetical protein
MACNTFLDWISCGVENIIFSTGRAGIETYKVTVTTAQGSKYQADYDSNAFGDISIPVQDFPAGLFNPYAGPFTINVDLSSCTPLYFCDEYQYLQFEVVNGKGDKNTITCCASGSENNTNMTCCTTETVNFVDETETVVPFTGTRPSIEVAYLQPDGSFVLSGISTLITFGANSFTVNHGGPASGIIKLLY